MTNSPHFPTVLSFLLICLGLEAIRVSRARCTLADATRGRWPAQWCHNSKFHIISQFYIVLPQSDQNGWKQLESLYPACSDWTELNPASCEESVQDPLLPRPRGQNLAFSAEMAVQGLNKWLATQNPVLFMHLSCQSESAWMEAMNKESWTEVEGSNPSTVHDITY